ncbi:Mu transposase C-terminal domain-containing protein [Mesobacillus selenatarsenatis]|uniref:Transposase n=1 Tax=Mesobacillus selenatarsenatis TaxID=388741 RepID=A0A846TGX2_9BACI|nr:Mu transposase C-terminal domain-containing protein [Mesobacillus selenatarsenatis]NKE04667.1 transposase [Mesobacillus selenatarsenatis]
MNLNQLKVNGELTYRGRKYIILDIEPPIITIKRYDGDGATIDINFFDLVTDPSFLPSKKMKKQLDDVNKYYTSLLDSLSEKEREEVSRRLEIIKPILVFERIKNNEFNAFYEFNEYYRDLLRNGETVQDLTKEALYERLAVKYCKSSRTVKRYYSSFNKAELENGEGDEGLISKSGQGHLYRRDNKILEICHPKHREVVLQSLTIRMDDSYIPIIKDAIEREYLSVKKVSKKAVYDLIEAKCASESLKPPPPITVYKLLGRISAKITDRLRLGSISDQKYQEITRGYSNNEALYPLHIVQIDHTQLDLDVLDEVGHVVGRPWLTLGIDVYSRKVWCFHLSFDPPSGNKVRKAIEQGVLLKKTKDRYNTHNEWIVYGIPNTFVFDNGKEFKNYEIERLIKDELKSHIRYRPIATPRYGGSIERLFGTINTQLIHRLEGTRKSTFSELGDYDPEKNALLSLEDVEELLTTYITDIYHHQPHKGLPLDQPTPMSRYVEGLKLSGYPEFISMEEETTFKIKLLPTIKKPYTRDGIRHNTRLYKSAALNGLIDSRNKKYLIKYDIDDISKIFLQHPETKEYHLVPCVSPPENTVDGMKESTFQLLKKQLKEQGKITSGQYVTEQQLSKAKEDLQRKYEEKYKKGRRARLEAKRHNFQVSLDIPAVNEPVDKNKPKSYKDILMASLEKEKRAKGIE